jgi:hypothetical protein
MPTRAADGAILVLASYGYTRCGENPILSFSRPSFNLRDGQASELCYSTVQRLFPCFPSLASCGRWKMTNRAM